MNEPVTSEVASQTHTDTNIAKVIYVLYLIGLISGVTAVVGVVMAYIYRDGAAPWLRSHYEFQIRTFWIALLYMAISTMLVVVLIGFVMYFAVAVWWIVRCVKCLKYVDQRAAYPNRQPWYV